MSEQTDDLLKFYQGSISEYERKREHLPECQCLNCKEPYPDDNPKTGHGLKKAPLNLIPPIALVETARAFKNGATKYGAYNWRDKTVTTSVYTAAALRHILAFEDGEDCADDSGCTHLGHAMACLAILLDAASIGKLNDDRPPKGRSGL
jgi:hypothetical protein